ncbi:MAG: homoaconitase [Phycisphaerales bacterium]|nr:MAG: homoaconitase [Phycisphaerales bacterium]
MPQTTIEKIATRYAVGLRPGQRAHAGDFLAIRPKHVMTHDNTGAVIPKFREIGAASIYDPKQPVFAIDHDIQNQTPENLGKYAKIEKFAREQGIDYYPPGRGIAHQVMVEEGYATPGALVVGSDSHSNLYGGVCALGTPVVRTDAAAIWATGQTWWQVPEQARVTLQGRLRPGVVGKDVIIALCGLFNNDEVLNCAVEFHGEGVASLSMDQRLTIANMTTEWGALAGVFPFDETLRDFLLERAAFFAQRGDATPRYTRADVERWWADRAAIAPDEGAHYSRELTLDLAQVTPHVAGPNEVKSITPLPEIEARRVKVDRAYLMSCVNARLEDLAQAAEVLRGKKVAEHVTFYLAAASSQVQEQAERLGYWKDLTDAGAEVLPPGCGACIGLGRGTLEPGEVGISATNRNFEGRMGSREALCYLASPVVVAASALRGYICAPEAHAPGKIDVRCEFRKRSRGATAEAPILEGFPSRVEGRILYLPKDNLNTDGIYGKDVTYRDDITREQQGRYAMLNYDPKFQEIAQGGDVIVGGRNFGTGSSREQAATALASRGIGLVIAASFNQTYARNAFNNGFIVIECPDLTDAMAEMFAQRAEAGERTIAGPRLTVDYARSVATLEGGREFSFPALSPVAQELVIAGGAEAVTKAALARAAAG